MKRLDGDYDAILHVYKLDYSIKFIDASLCAFLVHCQANEDEDLNVKWKLFYLQCSNIAFEPEPGIVSIYMSLSLHICKK